MVTRCTSRPSDRSRRRPLSRTKRPRRTRDGGARRSRRAPPSRLREAAFSGPVRRRRRPTARRNAPPARIRGRPHRRGPRGGGRVDLYAGFCCRPPLPARRWRPFILARRCRRARATYPQARTSSPRAPAARSCSGRGLPSRRSRLRRWWALTPPFHPYRPDRPAGGLLSVALSRGSPRVAVSHRPALWSPDVPRPAGRPAVPRPPGRLVRAQHSTASPAPPQPTSSAPPRAAPRGPAGARPRRASDVHAHNDDVVLLGVDDLVGGGRGDP